MRTRSPSSLRRVRERDRKRIRERERERVTAPGEFRVNTRAALSPPERASTPTSLSLFLSHTSSKNSPRYHHVGIASRGAASLPPRFSTASETTSCHNSVFFAFADRSLGEKALGRGRRRLQGRRGCERRWDTSPGRPPDVARFHLEHVRYDQHRRPGAD